MDPNTALENAREAAQLIYALGDRAGEDGRLRPEDLAAHEEAGDRLAEAFEALDDWLTKGGFYPEPWSLAR